MDKVIAYVDDPACARDSFSRATLPTHWVLVACAPRMTHRISKWVSHSAREHWRTRWADKLFGELVPPLRERGDVVTVLVAKGPLSDITRCLMAEHGTSQVVDARRPRSSDGPQGSQRWGPGALLGLGALLVVGAD